MKVVFDSPSGSGRKRGLSPLMHVWFCALWLSGTVTASAVMFFETDNPEFNTTPPEGALAGSGWQFQGKWKGFPGTPIAPRFFITAAHVGGQVGDKFSFDGVEYTAIARFDDPASDLRIWRVCGSFPTFAPLYAGNDEQGKNLVVFGRGTRRGEPLMGAGTLGEELKGWRWGASDGVLRWGENQVAGIINGDGMGPLLGESATVGYLLEARFNAGGGPNQAHLSAGDSGGGVFIQEDGIWKLAGINFAVSGPYNTSSSGSGFHAAIFDEGGLYTGGQGNWSLTPNLPVDLPGKFYATRISSNLPWIQSVLQDATIKDPPLVLQSAAEAGGVFANDAAASVDMTARTIRVPRSGDRRFFRLSGCAPLRIAGIHLEGEEIVITFEFE